MNWAGANACVVLTQDLDFGAILAVSGWRGPSVVQLRGGDLRAARIGDRVATVIQSLEAELRIGALVTISSATERVKLLPLRLPRVPDNA